MGADFGCCCCCGTSSVFVRSRCSRLSWLSMAASAEVECSSMAGEEQVGCFRR